MLSLIVLELTLREIVADLPHDGGAVVVLLLMLAIVCFIWHGSRGASAAPGAHPRGEAAGPRPKVPSPSLAEGEGPTPEPVYIDPALLSRAPDVRRLHPEVR